MAGKEKFANNDNNDNSNKIIKKDEIFKIQKIKINQVHCNLFNIIFFEIFLILLLKISRCSGAYYIEIKVNKEGDNQIISDDYIIEEIYLQEFILMEILYL